jgi:hypothetical protein
VFSNEKGGAVIEPEMGKVHCAEGVCSFTPKPVPWWVHKTCDVLLDQCKDFDHKKEKTDDSASVAVDKSV